jgi:predicted ATPase
VQWALGHPERALRRADEAIALAPRVRHVPSLAQALWRIGEFHATRRDVAAVTDVATELLRLSEEHGLPQQKGHALMFNGWALARSGETWEGIARLEEGLSVLSRLGLRFMMTGQLCRMAERLLAAQQYTRGLERAAQALDLATEIGETLYVARLYQLRAELLLGARGSDDDAVDASLQRALVAAQSQGAKGYELSAAIRLARVWLDRGRRETADCVRECGSVLILENEPALAGRAHNGMRGRLFRYFSRRSASGAWSCGGELRKAA